MLARRSVVLAATSLLLLTFTYFGCSSSKNKTTNPVPSTKELDSGTLAAGSGVFVHIFASAGTFPYHCSIHPVMTASIAVASSGVDSMDVSIVSATSTGFSPQTGTVKPGGKVTWRNVSTAPHTVTSD